MMHENDISRLVIGCAIEVHKILGPGLLESVYEECLSAEMKANRLSFERQQPIPLTYRGMRLDCGYRVDFVIEDKVVLELKAVEAITPVMEAQLLSYLRLLDKRLGLLMNFHVDQMVKGLRRNVNKL